MSVLGELSHSGQPSIRRCWGEGGGVVCLFICGGGVVGDANFFSRNDSFIYVLLQGWSMRHHHVTGEPNIPSQDRSRGTTRTSADYLNDKYEWCIDRSVVWWFCTALTKLQGFCFLDLFCLCSVCSRHAENTTGVYMWIWILYLLWMLDVLEL